MDDPNSDTLYAALVHEFGGHIHGWPRPDDGPAAEARINRALAAISLPAIDNAFQWRFWHERQHGQLDEDAGGFHWRCWCRAMKQPNTFFERFGRGYPSTEHAA